jgi:hypothetical protein
MDTAGVAMTDHEKRRREAELPMKEFKLAGYDILAYDDLKEEAHSWVHPATVAWCRKSSGTFTFLYYFSHENVAPDNDVGWYMGDPIEKVELDEAIPRIRDWFENDEDSP